MSGNSTKFRYISTFAVQAAEIWRGFWLQHMLLHP